MRAGLSDLAGNRLLSGLPENERALVLPICEVVTLRLGGVLCEAGELIRTMEFPIDGAISILDIRNAEIVEITVIGNEGCSGSSVIQGECSSSISMVETDARAVRAAASILVNHLPRTPYLRAALQRHHSLVLRHGRIALACRASHSPAQRLAKWLKLFSDRTELRSFPFTAALVATKIGMSSQEATYAIEDLQRHGVVNKEFDYLIINDGEALVLWACGCWSLKKTAAEQYLADLRDLARAYQT